MGNATLEFIRSEVLKWGETYVDNLIDNKYFPVETTQGFRWLYISDADYPAYVDRALDSHELVW